MLHFLSIKDESNPTYMISNKLTLKSRVLGWMVTVKIDN